MRRPSPVPEWRRVLRYSWSIRASIVSALFSGAEVAMQFLAPDRPSLVFAATVFLLSVAATGFRLLYQPRMHDAKPSR